MVAVRSRRPRGVIRHADVTSDHLVGTEIAGFRLERLLGHGSAGEIYLAYDLRLGRRVALKLLPPELADDPAFRERFIRESRVLASLEHPNVVPVYAAGEEAGRAFVAERYVREGTLRAQLRAPLDPSSAVSIAGQIARALDAAHARQLVHRDVRPQNILVDANGAAYLIDFFVPTVSAPPGQVFGTPPYMAPEQCRGQELHGRTDQYALACVLFECLTGEPPYGDEGVATIAAHVHGPIPRLSERRPGLPRALDAVFEQALAKDAADRFETCEAMVGAVSGALSPDTGRPEGGTVTFLFTDIEGSTRLVRRLRDRYPQVVEEHQRLVRAALSAHGGREVDTQGDSFFAVFPTATQAVLAGIEAQRAIAGHVWPDDLDVRIRTGIHTGRASLAGDRYFGLAVHRAARICAVATGGQTVVSETTRTLLDDEEHERPGFELRDLGARELKDFDRAVRLYEVAG
jgi:serine/threonine protein kinase